jgi:hypothetical protein
MLLSPTLSALRCKEREFNRRLFDPACIFDVRLDSCALGQSIPPKTAKNRAFVSKCRRWSVFHIVRSFSDVAEGPFSSLEKILTLPNDLFCRQKKF